jgi:hypothetical protein
MTTLEKAIENKIEFFNRILVDAKAMGACDTSYEKALSENDYTMENIITYSELHKAVQEKQIIGAITTNGEKHRFFISKCDKLCKYNKKSRKWGTVVSDFDIYSYVK